MVVSLGVPIVRVYGMAEKHGDVSLLLRDC